VDTAGHGNLRVRAEGHSKQVQFGGSIKKGYGCWNGNASRGLQVSP
jgi:hypothetical protein